MLARWIDTAARVPDHKARETLESVFIPDYAIEIGVPLEDRVTWLRSRFTQFGRDPVKDPVRVVAPMSPDGRYVLRPGQQVLVFYRIEGQGYVFVATVRQSGHEVLSDGVTITVATLSSPEEVYRHQRREYLRVRPNKTAPAELEWEGCEEIKGTPLKGRVEDISVGGVRVRFDEFPLGIEDSLREASQLSFSLVLDHEGETLALRFSADLIRIVREQVPRRALWVAGRWTDMTPADMRILSTYVVQQERLALRKRREAIELSGRPGRR